MLNRYRQQLKQKQILSTPESYHNRLYYYVDKNKNLMLYICSKNSLREKLADGYVIYIPFIYNGCPIQVKGQYYDI